MQHLDELESCGLIRSRKAGRVRIDRLAAGALASAEHWMRMQRAIFERRLDQCDNVRKEMKEQQR